MYVCVCVRMYMCVWYVCVHYKKVRNLLFMSFYTYISYVQGGSTVQHVSWMPHLVPTTATTVGTAS